MAQDYIIKIEGSWPSGETEYVIGTENPERLPAVSASDNGDVLTVVEGKWQDAAPSAGGLPAVTSDDNGDVLTVVNGAWDKAAPSGGGLVVNVAHEDGTQVYTADTKAGVIFAALEAGQYVRFQTDFGTVGYPSAAFYSFLGYALEAEAGYGFGLKDSENVEIMLVAATADDYPTSSDK